MAGIVRVAGVVAALFDDLAAVPLEAFSEELRDGARVVGIAVAQQEGGLGAQILHGELRGDIGLIVVAERHHVRELADLLGQVGHRAAGIEIGNAGILRDRRTRQIEAGIANADDRRSP